MNFEYTEEHLAVKEAARDFAQNILLPTVIERDEEQRFGKEEIRQLSELGFMGMMVTLALCFDSFVLCIRSIKRTVS